MLVKRDCFEDLTQSLKKGEILILIGARQVGKTHLMTELEKFAKAKKKKTKYFNLEIPEDSRYFNQDIVNLYKDITRNTDFIFIDEFQYFENASSLFKAIFDDRKLKVKIIASGSSSLEIHKHLKESLAGRKIEKHILPLSFNEFKQVKKTFENYLIYGGLPGLIHLKNDGQKIDLLSNLVATYILKDIKSLIKEENIPAFNRLIYILADTQAQIVSVSSLSRELMVSNKTAEHYLSILEQTFVLYPLYSFSQNLSNELKKSKKYFLFDNGIRNSIINDFSRLKDRADKGTLHESYVHSFIRRQMPKNAELRFWRTKDGSEIDFIYIKNRKPSIIEVKSKLKKMLIPEAFERFLRSYPNTEHAFIINENISGELDYRGRLIKFIKFEDMEEDEDFLGIFEN
ncbi:MAG: ATP-binding protein [bacterium]